MTWKMTDSTSRFAHLTLTIHFLLSTLSAFVFLILSLCAIITKAEDLSVPLSVVFHVPNILSRQIILSTC